MLLRQVLTDFQQFNMIRNLGDSLAGRIIHLLPPLSHRVLPGMRPCSPMQTQRKGFCCAWLTGGIRLHVV